MNRVHKILDPALIHHLELLFDMTGILELSSRSPGIICETIVIDALISERDITFFKELPNLSSQPTHQHAHTSWHQLHRPQEFS